MDMSEKGSRRNKSCSKVTDVVHSRVESVANKQEIMVNSGWISVCIQRGSDFDGLTPGHAELFSIFIYNEFSLDRFRKHATNRTESTLIVLLSWWHYTATALKGIGRWRGTKTPTMLLSICLSHWKRTAPERQITQQKKNVIVVVGFFLSQDLE